MKRVLELAQRFWNDPRPFQLIFAVFGTVVVFRLAERFWPETLFVILVAISVIALANTKK
ncbi:MAG TPA: hypothetical protein PLH22_00955 [Candidatus Colwellbacteria bacterium]|nr:hypothetical protein [Candidatus Colwellbacteria bacterium]